MISATTKPGILLTSQLLRAQTHYTVHEDYTGCQKGLITFKQWEKNTTTFTHLFWWQLANFYRLQKRRRFIMFSIIILKYIIHTVVNNVSTLKVGKSENKQNYRQHV